MLCAKVKLKKLLNKEITSSKIVKIYMRIIEKRVKRNGWDAVCDALMLRCKQIGEAMVLTRRAFPYKRKFNLNDLRGL